MQKNLISILYVSYYQKEEILIYDAETETNLDISSQKFINDLYSNGSVPKQWIEVSNDYIQVLPVVRFVIVNQKGYKLNNNETLAQLGLRNQSQIIIVLDQLLFQSIDEQPKVCCNKEFIDKCQQCGGQINKNKIEKYISQYDSTNEYHKRYWQEQFYELNKVNQQMNKLLNEQTSRRSKQEIEQNFIQNQDYNSDQNISSQKLNINYDSEIQIKIEAQESQCNPPSDIIIQDDNSNNLKQSKVESEVQQIQFYVDQYPCSVLQQDSVDQLFQQQEMTIQKQSTLEKQKQLFQKVKQPIIQKSPPLLIVDKFDELQKNNYEYTVVKSNKVLDKDQSKFVKQPEIKKVISKPIIQKELEIKAQEIKAQLTQVEKELLNEINTVQTLIKQNILDIVPKNQEEVKIIQQEKEILIETFQCAQEPKKVEDKVYKVLEQQKYHKIDNAIKRRINENKRNNKIIDPLKVNQKQVVQDKNNELVMFVLADQMKNSGKVLHQTTESEQLNIYSLQASFSDQCESTVCEKLTLQETPQLTFNQLKDNNFKEQQFYNSIRQVLAKQYNVKPEDVNILSIEEGSINVKYKIQGVVNAPSKEYTINEINRLYPGSKPVLALHQYFESIQLSPDDFDPAYNMEWSSNLQEYELRGPPNDKMKYFYPKGWKGYALKVKGKFDKGKDDWLLMDSNPRQWHIMYHGTDNQGCKGIQKTGFKPGQGQVYSKSIDIRFNQVIGDGIYFSNHIEVCEGYCRNTTIIQGSHYKVVFMSRVKPSSLKQVKKSSDIAGKSGKADWDNDYFVVNNPEDIRPYRILLKKI